MLDAVAAAPAPKKPFNLKTLFVIISIVLGALGIDHYTLNLVSGGSVTVTDSTIVVSAPSADTAVADTSKTK